MRKKTLLLLLLLNSNLFAEENVFLGETLKNGAIQVHSDELTTGKKDWIAVYPKNASTAWKNVIDWKWVKDLPYASKGHRYLKYNGASRIEKSGEYEVRYFKNNTYSVYKSFDFKINKTVSFLDILFYNEHKNEIYLRGFKKDITAPADKDWIGIYKKEDDNSWGNVIEWIWAKDSRVSQDLNLARKDFRMMSLNLKKYQSDEVYEARYFLNNSFTTYKSSPSFVVSTSKLNLKEVKGFYNNGSITFIAYKSNMDKDLGNGKKDWIGLYKKNDSNAWKNVFTWGWVKDFHGEDVGKYELEKDINLTNGEYEVRYFLNNSFTTYKSSTFKVD